MTARLQIRIIFVTGTDTGIGKTLLTALLLAHARGGGQPANAIKPFCSGSRADANTLHALQDGELTIEEINPFFFTEPLAPWVAARKTGHRAPELEEVLTGVHVVCSRLASGSILLIEGVGGLLVPLGASYTVLDLIAALDCEVLLVSANRLGTINHTWLSVEALRNVSRHRSNPRAGTGPRTVRPLVASSKPRIHRVPSKIVLMNTEGRDASKSSNAEVLTHVLAPSPVFTLPFLGPRASSLEAIRKNAKKFKKTLARILG